MTDDDFDMMTDADRFDYINVLERELRTLRLAGLALKEAFDKDVVVKGYHPVAQRFKAALSTIADIELKSPNDVSPPDQKSSI